MVNKLFKKSTDQKLRQTFNRKGNTILKKKKTNKTTSQKASMNTNKRKENFFFNRG